MNVFELVIEVETQSIELHTPSGPLPAIDVLIVTLTDSNAGELKTKSRLRLPLEMAQALRDQLTLTLEHIRKSRDQEQTSH